MNQIKHSVVHLSILSLLVLFVIQRSVAQIGASASFTVQNLTQNSPTSFRYDVFMTNTGTTLMWLRGYSWGLNHTNGLENGGTISHSFISRDTILNTIVPVSVGYTASFAHLRATTTTSAPGNEVALLFGIPVRIGTMEVSCTLPFASNSNPFLPTPPLEPIQAVTLAGRTQCTATCYVNAVGGTSYLIFGTANTIGHSSQLNVLSTQMFPNPLGSAPFLLNVSALSANDWELNGQVESDHNLLKGTLADFPQKTFYTLEASRDGINYKPYSGLELVIRNQYQFFAKHQHPQQGSWYYRIIARNVLGECLDTSPTVHLRTESQVKLEVFPNPLSVMSQLIITLAEQKSLQLRITDMGGKLVYEDIIDHNASQTIYPLSLMHLPSGRYVLQVSSEDGIFNTFSLLRP